MSEPSPHRSLVARSRSAIRVGLALALLVLLSLSPGVAQTVGAPPGTWVLTRHTVGLIAAADPALAERFFATPRSAVLGGWGGAVPSVSWPSYSSFAAAVATGAIPPGTSAVMYDPEGWAATPRWEREDPSEYMKAFSELAHSRGYAVILTPHPNLTTEPGAVCPVRPGEPMEDAYLRCRIPAIAARFADTLDIQAQFLESDPARYTRVVRIATQQARAVNPDIVVVSHLSTTFAPNATVLFSAWSAVRGIVDGHYLSVPDASRADIALGFLRMVNARTA